jgi:hypothetical protein
MNVAFLGERDQQQQLPGLQSRTEKPMHVVCHFRVFTDLSIGISS